MNGQRLRIAYVSTYGYASGPANDVRSRGVMDALRNLGGEVAVMTEPGSVAAPWRWLPQVGPVGRAARLMGLGSGVIEWLNQLEHVPDVIWLYGLDARFSMRVMLWAKRRHIPLVCEVVDWYQLRDMTGVAPRAVLALTNFAAMPWARRSADGFIVASRELGEYFGKGTATTKRIPAVIPVPVISASRRSHEVGFVVGYVGAPGKRDGLTLRNLELVAGSWDGPRLEIHVAGSERPEKAWITAPQVRVIHHGRIARDQAVELVASCDATVLQRPIDRRFARAGFPSKVAESMMLGTVPVTNASSDLGLELTAGRDSILLEDESAEALSRGLRQLVDDPIDRLFVAQSGHELFSVTSAELRIQELLSEMEVL